MPKGSSEGGSKASTPVASSAGSKAAAAGSSRTASDHGKVSVQVVEARNLVAMDSNGKSDPFCVVRFNKDAKTKEVTQIIKKTLNPVWNETFEWPSDEPLTDRIDIVVWDYDRFSPNDYEGHMSVPVIAAASKPGEPLDQWFPLLDKGRETKSSTKKERGEIHLIITFTPHTSSPPKHRRAEAAASDAGAAPAAASSSAGGKPSKVIVEPSHGAALAEARWEIPYNELLFGKKIGSGAFGVVFRGKWRLQDVAVKQLHLTAVTPEQLEEFRAESRLMMNLRPHRNVVPLLGVCTAPENPLCLVIDFIEGGTLEKLIKTPVIISWRLCFNICKGIAAGVYHLHQERILHRDLAARNVLLRGNHEPLIADFGLSKKVEQVVSANPKDTFLVKTKEDVAIRGPYKWMAPESLSNNEFSIKSDIWSYGVVVWEIISRSEPFPEFDIFQAAQKIVHEHLRLPIPPNVPSKFVNLMTWCWRTNPDDRPDFVDVARALADIELVVDTF